MKTPKVASKGNVGKHANYAWAMDQMKKAHAAGFFLETVALAESILSDRIWSFVKGTSGGPSISKDATLGKIITFKNAFKDAAPAELHEAVKVWADDRNKLLHGIVKSYAGTAPMAIDDDRSLAARTASKALELVPAIDRWHKQKLRAHRARSKSK